MTQLHCPDCMWVNPAIWWSLSPLASAISWQKGKNIGIFKPIFHILYMKLVAIIYFYKCHVTTDYKAKALVDSWIDHFACLHQWVLLIWLQYISIVIFTLTMTQLLTSCHIGWHIAVISVKTEKKKEEESLHVLLLLQFRVTGGLEHYPSCHRVSEKRGTPVWTGHQFVTRLTQRDNQPFTLTFTP